VLHSLVDKGNTVIVIEHNLDVIKTADWVIDMGPEGGSGGGLVIAEGTPEAVAQLAGSYTGEFLKPMLETHAGAHPTAPKTATKAKRTAAATRSPAAKTQVARR